MSNLHSLEKVIEKILDGEAVLFTGAGFSYGAKNAKGQVPSAKELKSDLLKELNIDNNTDYGLETIAEFYSNKTSPKKLVEKLKYYFNIVSVADHHKKIANLPWKRVYTTNYDQVMEKASSEIGCDYRRDPIVFSDSFTHSRKDLICVHINGYIERLNANKLNNEFKLTDTSYSCDLIKNNPWFEFMINDFESASVIIIIGYSMQYDIDIKRLLSAPTISQKVIFIDSPKIDEISKELIEHYGKCYPIGIQCFSDKIENVKKDYIPRVNFSFKSFKHIYRDTLEIISPSYEEIVKFYTEGRTSENLLEKDQTGEYKCLLYRKAMDIFLRRYKTQKVFIALSNLGNGKSTFLDMVENELRKEDVMVFTYKHRYDLIDREIEQICSENKRCVIIIDNYPGHMDILDKFYKYGHSNITFLLSARNGVNQIFCKQLERKLHISSKDICPLYLNNLQDDETERLSVIFENNKLLTEAVLNLDGKIQNLNSIIREDCKSQFSNFLLRLFDSSDIKNRLTELYSKLEQSENEQIKEVVIFSLLKNISNYDITFYEILDLFNADYISITKNEVEFIPEIFEQSDEDSINVRSSIISMSLLKNIIKLEDIIKTMKKAFLSADSKSGKTYTELQKSMVSHSQFVYLTHSSNERDKFIQIESFYDDIRNTKFAKHNPFFWEQFASAYIDMKKFDLVKKCIDTALVEASKIQHFVPFQVRTVQGRYYVEKCYFDVLNGKCSSSEAIEAISNSFDSILKHYSHPENNLYYVFKVVRFYPIIFNIIKDNMDKRELSIYIEKASIMCRYMDIYLLNNSEDQSIRKVEKWKRNITESIDEAKEKLKKYQ